MNRESNRRVAEWCREVWNRTTRMTVQNCNRYIAVQPPHGPLAVLPAHIHRNVTRHGLALNPIPTGRVGRGVVVRRWDDDLFVGCMMDRIEARAPYGRDYDGSHRHESSITR